jgi:drug/metabolite transporter (DMT)-like permease
MTYGFKFISSTRGSIATFSKIPMTIVLSLFIGEEFKLKFIIGTILIIIGLIINRK